MCQEEIPKLEILMPIRSGLKNLKERGKSLIILSGGKKQEIELCLQKNKLEKIFDNVLGDEKNKEQHLNDQAAKKGDILIGDSSYDYHCARKFDMVFLRLMPFTKIEQGSEMENLSHLGEITTLSPKQFNLYTKNL